jgi:ribosome recycling factor
MNVVDSKTDFEQGITFLKKELSVISAGRADPSQLEDVVVTAYDSQMKLQELASITVPEPRVLLVEPWDKSLVKDIGGAIKTAQLDGQIQETGNAIRFIIPQMTEENRNRYVKIVREKLENARINVRRVRDKLKDRINQEEKTKEISEDEKYTQLKQLDELAGEFTTLIKDIGEQKEKDILTI